MSSQYSTTDFSKIPERIPIFSPGRKRAVGTVYPDRKTFRKTIKGSCHLLQYPPAIANDVSVLRNAQKAGAEWAEIEDTETGITYRAKIDHIFESGTPFNRGWGNQIFLELDGWITKSKPVQLGMWG